MSERVRRVVIVYLENAVVDVHIRTESRVSGANDLIHLVFDVQPPYYFGKTHVASDALPEET